MENKEMKYKVKVRYNVVEIIISIILFGAGIAMTVAGMWASHVLGIFTFIATLFISIVALARGITNDYIFKCPKCNEEIILSNDKMEDININEITSVCPKCKCNLVFNKKSFLVAENNTIKEAITVEKNEQENENPTKQIEELFNLKNKGIISEEEFEAKKQELLKKI